MPKRYCAFVSAAGQIGFATDDQLPAKAMPVAFGPEQSLRELITPRAQIDTSGLHVPGMADAPRKLAIEALSAWSEQLGRYNRDPEINVI